MINLRVKSKREKIKTHPDFEVVPRGQEDVMIIRWGCKSGTIYTDPKDYAKYEDYHIFLKVYGDEVIERLKYIEPILQYGATEKFARTKNCYLSDVVDAYVERYGRPDII